jgi:protein-tyrosine-phosphatase
MRSILFVCEGNTCRSVMAEALAKERFRESVRVASAGIHPQSASDARPAINALKAHFGVDTAGHTPRDVRTVEQPGKLAPRLNHWDRF